MCEGRQNSLLYSLRSREVGRRRHETRNFLDTDGCISRLYLRKKLEGHRGCVNTVEYNEEGTLIVSGSDDTQLRLWCASTLREVAVVDTGHSRNIFCAKLVPNTNNTRAISCGADGEIRLSCVDLGGKHTTPGSVLESGLISNASPTLLHSTARLALSLVFLPLHPSAFLGTSQDGCIRLYDLRQDVATASSGTFLQMEPQSSATSLAFNPLDPYSFVMGAEDPLIRVYDIRRPPGKELLAAKSRILQTRAPPELLAQMRSGRMSSSGVSGVDFNRFGEVLATYRNDDMYLFNIKDYAPERVDDTEVCMAGFVRFSGHRNQDTFLKNAKFLGQGRFVATGSDCGHLFIWNKASGALVRKIRADAHVVNGLAPHPYLPLVVTCGIDSDVKVLDLGEDKPAPPRTPSQGGGGARAAILRRGHAIARPRAGSDPRGGRADAGGGGCSPRAGELALQGKAARGGGCRVPGVLCDVQLCVTHRGPRDPAPGHARALSGQPRGLPATPQAMGHRAAAV